MEDISTREVIFFNKCNKLLQNDDRNILDVMFFSEQIIQIIQSHGMLCTSWNLF